jgi:hypothetical protein
VPETSNADPARPATPDPAAANGDVVRHALASAAHALCGAGSRPCAEACGDDSALVEGVPESLVEGVPESRWAGRPSPPSVVHALDSTTATTIPVSTATRFIWARNVNLRMSIAGCVPRFGEFHERFIQLALRSFVTRP